MNLAEERTAAWLEHVTDDDLFMLARLIRRELSKRIEEFDAHGDGPMVNALCIEARKYFTACLVW